MKTIFLGLIPNLNTICALSCTITAMRYNYETLAARICSDISSELAIFKRQIHPVGIFNNINPNKIRIDFT